MKEENILKYLNGQASYLEEEEMELWILQSKDNARRFNLIKAQHIASTLSEGSGKNDEDEAFTDMMGKIHYVSDKRNKKRNTVFRYAAVLFLIFGTGYLFMSGFNKKVKNYPVVTSENTITLQFDNGFSQIINEDGICQIYDKQGKMIGSQDGSQIIYNKDLDVDELVYNTLTVPYGKHFDIKLSDGTNVILNAGTSLKYPVKFINGKSREVYLSGEGYFDVAKDASHPFIVHTDAFEVRVLGTQFNITSYPDDNIANTVLVEGSVRMYEQGSAYDSETSALLEPGNKAAWSKNTKDISIQTVDTDLYTSWIRGKISFRHMPFKYIKKKLERHYNVEIINNNEDFDNKLFTASFDVETIEQVLESFKKYDGINYRINHKQIIIDP